MSGDNKELYDKLAKLIEDTNKHQTVELKKEIQAEVSGIKNEIIEIKKIITEETNKRNQLEERQERLENKNQFIERIIKKNNIIIFGLKNDNGENLAEFTILKLNSLLELDLTVANINNVFHLGKGDGNRPILVQFISFLTKIQILRNCKKLKGTGISISDDLTKEEREIRKVLVKHKKWAQSKGHITYIRNNKLHVNDKIYTHEDLEGNIWKGSENAGEYETDSDVDLDEIEVEEENETGGENDGELEININKRDSEEKENSDIGNQESNPKRSKVKGSVNNPNIKKRKAEAAHLIGPITRRFKRNQKKTSPKNKLNSNKETQKPTSLTSDAQSEIREKREENSK